MTISAENRAAAEKKLQDVIRVGLEEAQKGAAKLHEEYSLRKDFIAKPSAIDIELKKVETPSGVTETWAPVIVNPKTGDRAEYRATTFARNQLLQHAGIPQRFAETLSEHGLTDLLRENLRRLLPETAPDGLLIREVGGTIKGCLSTAYRRMDASPIFSDYLETSLKLGYVPRSGKVTDTRALISFIEPKVYDVGTDLVIIGHSLRTSDYGNGGLELDAYVERLLCLNGLMGYDFLRKVHLGRRFEGEGDVIELSNRTIELDTRAVRSALKDVLNGAQKQLTSMTEVLAERLAAGENLSLTAALEGLKKKGLRAETIARVKATYENDSLPIEALPPAQGAWRLANALSLLAKTAPGDEAIELQDAAFGILGVEKQAKRLAA